VDQEPGDSDDSQPSIADLCTQLVADTRLYVRAEIARFRALAFRRIVKGRMAIFFMVSSALLAQSAVLVMLVGLLMFLRNHVGIVWATAITTVLALVAAAIFGRLAFWQVRRAIGEEDDLT
jgi:hypothetical protein